MDAKSSSSTFKNRLNLWFQKTFFTLSNLKKRVYPIFVFSQLLQECSLSIWLFKHPYITIEKPINKIVGILSRFEIQYLPCSCFETLSSFCTIIWRIILHQLMCEINYSKSAKINLIEVRLPCLYLFKKISYSR